MSTNLLDTPTDPVEALRQREREKADATERQRQDALITYRQLLARADKPKPGDAQALADAAAVLALTSADVDRDRRALARDRWCASQELDDEAAAASANRRNDELSALSKLHVKTLTELFALVPDETKHETLKQIRPFLLVAIPNRVLKAGVQPPINDLHHQVKLQAREPRLADIDPANYDQTCLVRFNKAQAAHGKALENSDEARKEREQLRRNFPRVFGGSDPAETSTGA